MEMACQMTATATVISVIEELVAVLEAVEWTGGEFKDECPWCYTYRCWDGTKYLDTAHHQDCQRKMVLARAKAILAREAVWARTFPWRRGCWISLN